ncbi:hypothetical protein [Burkholderia sp. BCC1993]|uniref:hypothetical protein n=1 Tax=Burkholderia sp. BCC1993 TaxID=2817444 RepID=UPI002AAFE454|nr:hypothetical protein [Burkholderia sp. BCC1993]
MPTLTVGFHSVLSGCWGELSTPELVPRSIALPLLTIEIHSVLSWRGSGNPHPNRRSRLNCMLSLTVEIHSVSSWWGGLSTPESASSFDRAQVLTIEMHSVFSVCWW